MGGDVAPAPRVGVVPPGAAHPVGLLDDGEVARARSDQLDGEGQPGEPGPHDDHAGRRPTRVTGDADLPPQSPAPDVQGHARSPPSRFRAPAPRGRRTCEYATMVGRSGRGHDAGALAEPGVRSPDSWGDRRWSRNPDRDRPDRPGIPSGPGPGPLHPGPPVPPAPGGPPLRGRRPTRIRLRERGTGRHLRWAGAAGPGPRPGEGGPAPVARLDVGPGPRPPRRPL